MIMQGDNFKPVSADTASWVLQQHFAGVELNDRALDKSRFNSFPKIIPVPKVKKSDEMKAAWEPLTKNVLAILVEVTDDTPSKMSLMRSFSQTHEISRLRWEFWSKCRERIKIKGKPAPLSWIGRFTGHDASTVHNGIRRWNLECKE